MKHANDTIVALSSAAGASARAVVRLSGPRSLEIAAAVLEEGREALLEAPGFSWLPARARLEDGPAEGLDGGDRGRGDLTIDVELFVMRAPRSYTREDVVEVHMLGSMPLVGLLLERLFEAGARQAEPGEFTRRAYLSGRIGLAQAEAVARLIAARSEAARRSAVQRLEGRLEAELEGVREAFVRILAVAEAYVDFTDTDTEALDRESLVAELGKVERRLGRAEAILQARPPDDTALQIVLYGARNAGKSTLFSRLVPDCATLISPVPGTTRDLVEGRLSLGELSVTLWDAPGVGEAADPLEAEAIARVHDFLDRCDLLLVLVDGAERGDPEETVPLARRALSHRRCVAVSRIDRGVDPGAAELARELAEPGWPCLEVSALTGQGLPALEAQLARRAEVLTADGEQGAWGVDASLRSALHRARRAVQTATQSNLGLQIELAIFDLREALTALSPWMGPVGEEEILDEVFSRFCIGK